MLMRLPGAPRRGARDVCNAIGGDVRAMGMVMTMPPHHHAQGPSERVGKRGERATVPIEEIWCKKIRGCSYRAGRSFLLNVRYAPIATKFCGAAK